MLWLYIYHCFCIKIKERQVFAMKHYDVMNITYIVCLDILTILMF